MTTSFSHRHGYRGPDAEITLREDAPDDLRYAVAEIARHAGLSPTSIRAIACRVLFVAPDSNNWSEYPNVWNESLALLRDCPWYKVYDIAEEIWRSLEYDGDNQMLFADELNRYFREKGIGWELKTPNGIVFRGGETFRVVTVEAVAVLDAAGHPTASKEVREALQDISRRPKPDVTGAIHHSMAALECTAREVSGDSKRTLGELIPKLELPKPLDEAVKKLWGFASERARHIREGESVDDGEAELLVSIACAISVYLAKRGRGA